MEASWVNTADRVTVLNYQHQRHHRCKQSFGLENIPFFEKRGGGWGGGLHFFVSEALDIKRLKRRVMRATQMN